MQENKKYSKDGKRVFTPAVPDDGKYQVVFYEQIIGISKGKIKTIDGKSANITNPLSSELKEGMRIAAGNTTEMPKDLIDGEKRVEVVDFEKIKEDKLIKEKVEDFKAIKKSRDDGERVG